MDTVDAIRSDIHCALKTKGHIRAPDIVIDGLRHMDNIQALLPKKVGSLLGSVSAQNHQAVQTQLMVGMLHGLYLVQSVFIRHPHHFEGLAGASQDGSALSQDSRKISRGQHPVISVNQALIAFLKAVKLYLIQCVAYTLYDSAHGRVQCLAISTAGQHSDSFHIACLHIFNLRAMHL